jgi:signal transduction histidine kinase/CheY-like chemotaxis protein/HAMP domain-containing protein
VNLKNIPIHFLLKLCLLGVLLGSSILGTISLSYHQALWEKYDTLYHHPLMVRRSIDEIKLDVLNIQLIEKDTYFDSLASIELSYHKIEELENKIENHFKILKDRYLGPPEDIETAYLHFTKFKQDHSEFHEKLIQGNRTEVQNAFILHMTEHKVFNEKLQTISNYSAQKGDSLYQEGSHTTKAFKAQLILLILIVFLSSWLLILFLMRSIKDPFRQLLPFLSELKTSNYQTRLPNLGRNEFGSLATAMNKLAETIAFDKNKQDKLETITDAIISTEDLGSFSQSLLQVLIKQTHAKAGAIYVLNDNESQYTHQASVGLNVTAIKEFDVSSTCGFFGLSLMSKKVERVASFSEHALLNIRCLEYDLLPREVLTIPVLSDKKVIALISLSSLDGFDELSIQTINDAHELINARMISILAFNRIKLFSQKLETQNQEIEEQKNELSRQSQELHEQNQSLETQKKQLQELNKLKTSFLSNMSHELRTPLNSIIALSSVLGKRWKAKMPNEEIEYLEVIEKSGKHLLELINDILNLSKLEAGKENLTLSHINLRELVSEVLSSIKPQADAKNLKLELQLQDDLVISSDATKLRHVLQNLIGNAVKFTEKGYVNVKAQQLDESLTIKVQDTGIGIAPEQLPYIFDEFRQADERLSKKYEGTGLGLAIAKKYAKLLHGNISVESTLGSGSIFSLSLPLPWKRSLNPSSYTIDDKRKKKILLIEDSEPALIQLKEILGHEGYQVITAENGLQGLKRIKEDDPDGIILDLMMPEMDGFEVLKTIRSDPHTKLLPVLILSAKHISKEELSFLKGNNIHQLIQKGDISKYDLLNAIQSMVFSSKSRTGEES